MGTGSPGKLRTRTRFSAHAIWDQLTDPSVTEAVDVPWRVEAVTPEWLTERICADVPGARVVGVRVHGRGDMGSTMHRWLSLEYNAAGAAAGLPASLFAKSTPNILTRLASGGRVVAQEHQFFTAIQRSLDIETPALRTAAIDGVSGRSILVFEDMVASKGAEFFGAGTVISRDYAEQIVDTLAEFHSVFWDSPRFAGDLSSLALHGTFMLVGERLGNRLAHDEAMDRAKVVIPEGVLQRRELIWPAAMASLELHDAGPKTLLHADVHLGNWYATGEHRIGLADWQNTCVGNWAFDFAYAVATTLAVEDRRSWERDLLRRYLDRLGHGVTFEAAWDSYRRALVPALILWTPTLVPSPVYPSMQSDEMSLSMINRITTAMDDLGSLEDGGTV